MGVGRSSSLRTTAERSPLHDVRQPASRDRRSTRHKNSGAHGRVFGKRGPLSPRFRATAFAIPGLPSHSRGAAKAGGARRDRTDDLLLAKQALSQLSYGPVEGALNKVVGLGRLELPTSRLSSARS